MGDSNLKYRGRGKGIFMAFKIKWDQVRDFVIFEGVNRLTGNIPKDCTAKDDQLKISNLSSHLNEDGFFERLGLSRFDLSQAMAFKDMASRFIRLTTDNNKKNLSTIGRIAEIAKSLHWKEDLFFFVGGLIIQQIMRLVF